MPVASAETNRWSADRANAWYAGQGWLLGANYVTSNAVNQIEMFQAGTYDPHRIDAELRVARQIGFNTMRVFLHDQLWATDRAGFSNRLAQFVDIAASHNIKPLFVLFDSCWDPSAQSRPSTGTDSGRAQLRLGAEPGGPSSTGSGLHPRPAELCHRRGGHVR